MSERKLLSLMTAEQAQTFARLVEDAEQGEAANATAVTPWPVHLCSRTAQQSGEVKPQSLRGRRLQ